MVPCIVNKAASTFLPLCKPVTDDCAWQKSQSKHPWLPAEDEHLLALTLQNGQRAWAAVARQLNSLIHNGEPVRMGKQCRERFFNHLDPTLNKGQWTNEEDLYILKKQQRVGNKWSEIARDLVGRTENQVKNRFKSMVKSVYAFSSPDPVALLIKNKNGDGLEIPRAQKLAPSRVVSGSSQLGSQLSFCSYRAQS